MPWTEQQEKELKSAVLTTRMLAFAMCYAAPAIYAVIYDVTVLEGRWHRFLQGFAQVPWTNPLVLALLLMSVTTLAGAFLLPAFLSRAQQGSELPPLSVLRAHSTIAFALVEAIAIYGLVMGFVVGPAVASLVLFLLLVPPACCPLLMANEEQWRERMNAHNHA